MSNSLKDKRFNERVKLAASALNTLGIGFVISGVVFPVVREGDAEAWMRTEVWASIVAGLILHLYGHATLGLLRAEG